MADHFYSPEARLDLLEIWEFIAQDNVDAADRVQQEVQQAVSLLARNPELADHLLMRALGVDSLPPLDLPEVDLLRQERLRA